MMCRTTNLSVNIRIKLQLISDTFRKTEDVIFSDELLILEVTSSKVSCSVSKPKVTEVLLR